MTKSYPVRNLKLARGFGQHPADLGNQRICINFSEPICFLR